MRDRLVAPKPHPQRGPRRRRLEVQSETSWMFAPAIPVEVDVASSLH
jgi:hypothetical protein